MGTEKVRTNFRPFLSLVAGILCQVFLALMKYNFRMFCFGHLFYKTF